MRTVEIKDEGECCICGQQGEIFGTVVHREHENLDLFCRGCHKAMGLALLEVITRKCLEYTGGEA